MYDETGSKRDEVFKGDVLPPLNKSLGPTGEVDHVERQLRMAVQNAARGLAVAAGCYIGYRLWKAMDQRG